MSEIGSGKLHFNAVDGGIPRVGKAVAAPPFQTILTREVRICLFPECWIRRSPHCLRAGAV